ncbi:MAG: sugar phosphate isomerase/epimerase family protein [Kiritimatiellia bacterium]
MQITRRNFLRNSLITAGLTGLSGCQSFAGSKQPIFKLSLAQWSLNRHFFKRVEPHIDPLDFAETASSHGIKAVEYVSRFYSDKIRKPEYLKEMKLRADDNDVISVLIMVGGEGNLGDPDKAKRIQAVENHYKWADAAKFLGCHSIRVNAASDKSKSYDEQMKLAADGLSRLTEYTAELGMNTVVENHGGLSSNGQWLTGVMKLVNSKYCGTLPDFGNFAINRKKNEWYDCYKGMRELMPYAKSVSAKSYEFDPKRPWITFRGDRKLDYLKLMRIVLDAGYRGYVGIESEGKGDQHKNLDMTRDMLLRVREKLTPEYT